MKTIKINILAVITMLVLAFALGGCGNSADNTASVQSSSQEKVEETADQTLTTIFCASDYQAQSGWDAPGDNLNNIINAAKADGRNIDQVIICGDYSNDRILHDNQISPENAISEIRGIVQEDCPQVKEEDILFVQGNHDRLTDSIAGSGLHEFDNYLVYVLNEEEDFPWKQGKTAGSLDKVRNTAEEMKACFEKLISDGETRPVIIAGHVPVHFTGRTSSLHTTGDNIYASLIFKEINKAAESLDIIFLYGHNHTKGWDCYLGQSCTFKAPGDSILIPRYRESDITSNDYSEETLNFYYLNAGYTGHCMNCSPDEVFNGTADQYEAADNTLTGTVIEIYEDRIMMTRYSRDGVYLMGSEGEADPYRDDSSLIPEKYYSEEISGPQEFTRKNQ